MNSLALVAGDALPDVVNSVPLTDREKGPEVFRTEHLRNTGLISPLGRESSHQRSLFKGTIGIQDDLLSAFGVGASKPENGTLRLGCADPLSRRNLHESLVTGTSHQ
jgi:hypothetical protein